MTNTIIRNTQNYTVERVNGIATNNGVEHYYHAFKEYPNNSTTGSCKEDLMAISFQCGCISEHGSNGVQSVDVLLVVLDQLKQFQNGEFSCRENAIAITKIEEAILWLNKRTQDRIERGVEGKDIK